MGQIWARPGQACDGLCIYKLSHLFSTSEAYIETSIEWIHVWSWSPRCSMYGIFTYIWAICGVNVGKYSTHGAFGIGKFSGNSSIKFQKSRKWLIHAYSICRYPLVNGASWSQQNNNQHQPLVMSEDHPTGCDWCGEIHPAEFHNCLFFPLRTRL